MHRRDFFNRALFCGLASSVHAATAKSPLVPFKLGAITDSFSQDFEQALRIMQGFGLSWAEIRQVYGVYNTEASTAQIRRMKDLLDKYQVRVSVIDSALFKCTLPGSVPVESSKDAYPYREQMELLKRAADRGHALGADKIRGFTFWRAANPGNLSGRIADELERAAEVARGAGMRLVIENEETCNAATGRELTQILAKAPARNLGINWDVGNGYWHGEASYPEGYDLLDKERIWHLHLKGVSCHDAFKQCGETLAGQGQIDLVGQLRQLIRDGYQETMSLECEFEMTGESHLETSKRSLQSLLAIMAEAIGKSH
jgi:sugar phosphate isomerase/epimerase